MTQQYQQEAINEQDNPSSLEIASYDFRQVQGLVPTGTTATIQGLQIPSGSVRLTRLAWCSVVAPAAGESVALRLFRIRPATDPAGFGFIQLNNTFTITPANFPGSGVEVDFSDLIRPDLCVFKGEYLACSWVHAGPQQMQPLNMNWSFRPTSGEPAEPPATTTTYSAVFG